MKIIKSITVACVTAFPLCGHSQTYDAVADFSTTNNPAGLWSYGQENSLDGSFSLLDTQVSFADGQLNGWDTANTFPFVIVNNTGGPVTDGNTVYPDATIAMHPSSTGQYSILRWTAPDSGLFSLNVSFSDIPNDAVATVDIHVLLDETSLFDGNLGPQTTTGYSNNTLSLASGDVIDFAVGYGSDENYNNDHTAVQAVITAVPEPAPSILVLLGAVLCFWRRLPARKSPLNTWK